LRSSGARTFAAKPIEVERPRLPREDQGLRNDRQCMPQRGDLSCET
jgi:hypothetical protein